MAGKARVHELAKELGVPSKEILHTLREMGESVKSASTMVESPIANRVRSHYAARKESPNAAPETDLGVLSDDFAGERRALVVGVTGGAGEDELSFAAPLAERVHAALSGLGYRITLASAATEADLSARALGSLVTGQLAGGDQRDVLILHLIGHGRSVGDATVYAVGADGLDDATTDISHWLQTQQFQADRPLVLLLLDLCFAGTAARLPWQTAIHSEDNQVWVIAACQSDEAAYDGRFSQAVATVLRALRAGDLDVDPSLRYVPLAIVARAIRQEVNRLATAADGYAQRVTASLVDLSADVELPFFPNPAYDRTPRTALRAGLDSSLLPFLDDLDEGLDARHFLDRATGVGRFTTGSGELIGCFSGRDKQLRLLAPWLTSIHGGPLAVLTGSPGAGKSALLGLLVCATHKQLRDPTRPIWADRVTIYPIEGLAAVHARRRGLGTVVDSIARQLDLPPVTSAAELIDRLASRVERPVVVVDALDEADDPESIMNEFLVPLARGGAPVRLLVGTRPYPEFAPLLDLVRGSELLVDLDQVPSDTLEQDLHTYVSGLLRSIPAYRGEGGRTGEIATAMARTLATPPAEGTDQRWGPFLVAGLYTRYLATTNPNASQLDFAVARRLGEQVPRDLPSVLDLDLAARPDQPWLRPVLVALAHAKGQGIPMGLLARIATTFDPSGATPTMPAIRRALAAASFYVRQSTDVDHSTVYRLFHQGLVDHLTGTVPPQSTTELVRHLLSALGPADARDWSAAEPYLIRHIQEHAAAAGCELDIVTDPGFLSHPDALPTFDHLHLPEPQWTVLRSCFADPQRKPDPATLALAATRAGMPDLARRAANPPNAAPLVWQPQWIRTSHSSFTDSVNTGWIANWSRQPHSAAITGLAMDRSGNSFVSVDTRNRLVRWNIDDFSAQEIPLDLPAHTDVVLLPGAREIAYRQHDGSLIRRVLDTAKATIDHHQRGALLAAEDNGRSLWLMPDGGVRVHSPIPGGTGDLIRPATRTTMWRGVFGPAGPVLLSTSGRTVILWDCRRKTGRVVTEHTDAVVDMSLTMGIDGWRLASCDRGGEVRLTTASSTHLIPHDADYGRPIVVATAPDRYWVAVGTNTGVVALCSTLTVLARSHAYDDPIRPITPRKNESPPRPVGPDGFTALAVVPEPGATGRWVVLAGVTDGTTTAFDLDSGQPRTNGPCGPGPVDAITVQRIGGLDIAAVHWPAGPPMLWDPVRRIEVPVADLAMLPLLYQARAAHRAIIVDGRLTVDEDALAAGRVGGQVVSVVGTDEGTVWVRASGAAETIHADGPVRAAAVTEDGCLLVCAGTELIAFRHRDHVR